MAGPVPWRRRGAVPEPGDGRRQGPVLRDGLADTRVPGDDPGARHGDQDGDHSPGVRGEAGRAADGAVPQPRRRRRRVAVRRHSVEAARRSAWRARAQREAERVDDTAAPWRPGRALAAERVAVARAHRRLPDRAGRGARARRAHRRQRVDEGSRGGSGAHGVRR